MAKLALYLHNGFSLIVEGNESAIDVVKDLVIPNVQVKGIVVVNDAGEKTKQMNYTQLKAERGNEP